MASVIVTNTLIVMLAEKDPYSWPGPKAWPVGLGLGNFFIFLALVQAFREFQ